MNIPVIIPWRTDDNLGKACNDICSQIQDWVLLLDHDVLMLNPEWYKISCRAAEKIGHKSGWISGTTGANFTRSPTQTDHTAPRKHDIIEHIKHAKQAYLKHGENIKKYKGGTVFSGFMILTHRKAWETVGGFVEGPRLPVDSQYHYRLIKHGYEAHVLPGLYMYHIHAHKKVWHNF